MEELVDRLRAIVSDSVKINEHRNDPEMVADLYHRIAEGHTTTPDMRVAWLQGLANFHLKQKSIYLLTIAINIFDFQKRHGRSCTMYDSHCCPCC